MKEKHYFINNKYEILTYKEPFSSVYTVIVRCFVSSLQLKRFANVTDNQVQEIIRKL